MHFQIDNAAPEPPSLQLEEQVCFAIASGRLHPGERLPSVRVLAAEVRVNPNTVGRAWRELERTGVLEMRRGDGAFVAAGALAQCKLRAEELVAQRLERVVREALAAGIAPERIADNVRVALAAAARDGRKARKVS